MQEVGRAAPLEAEEAGPEEDGRLRTAGSRRAPGLHPAKAIARILAEARTRLGMEVAFVSEFTGGRRVFRFLDGNVDPVGLEVDGGDPLADTYCSRVVEGRIPNLIPDASCEPGVQDLPATRALGIGAHVSVPVVFSDGRLYGTFCCFSRAPDYSVSGRDVDFIRAMADLVTEELEREELHAENRRTATDRVRRVLRGAGLSMVFQPIRDLNDWRVMGAEALARFHADPPRTPDRWFEEAWTAGLGVELELEAARAAAARLGELPAGAYLSINISPETALSSRLQRFLREVDGSRIVLELTEHTRVADYPPLRTAFDECRAHGVRIAIDDVGTGYAGLQHFLELRPDILKLDVSVTRGIHADPLRQSVAAAVASFATGAPVAVVAEGIESRAEADVLQRLGIAFGQGYYLGRPAPLPLP